MTRRGTSRITSLGVSLVLALATMVIGTGPAAAEHDTASDVPTLASVGVGPAMETEPGDVQSEEEPITVAEVQELVAQLAADRQITRYGENQLRFTLYGIERLYGDGRGCSDDLRRQWFFTYVERFERHASNPDYVLTESARDQLLAAADQLRQLCGASEASG